MRHNDYDEDIKKYSACEFAKIEDDIQERKGEDGTFSCLNKEYHTFDDYFRCDSSPRCGNKIIQMPGNKKEKKDDGSLNKFLYETIEFEIQNEVCKYTFVPGKDLIDKQH